MRIGIYDPYLDDLGGGEKYMMTIAECLAKKHEVTVFWDREEDLEKLIKRFSLHIGTVKIRKNIFSQNVRSIDRVLQSRKYDAIFLLSDGSFPFVFSKKLFIHFQQPIAKVNIASWKNKLKFKKITEVFYNSKFTQSFYEDILPGIVIYPPVDIQVKEVDKENIILHVGRFRAVNVANGDFKKQGVMIKAFKEMVDNGLKDWNFILAVSVNEKDEAQFKKLQETAKDYPITFLVNKNNDELWDIYSKAKIYWHASGYGEDLENHPEFAEHFGISTVEAMGAGAVPVVINAGGQKEIVTDAENGFLWDTLDELQGRTTMLIEDNELLMKLSKNALKKVDEFSKDKFYKAVNRLLEK